MKVSVSMALGFALAAASAPAASQTSPAPSQPSSGTRPAPAQPTRSTGLTIEKFLNERSQAFAQMDANHDGTVTLAEMTEFQRQVDRQNLIKFYQQLFNRLDADRNGQLSGEEFMKMAVTQPTKDQKPYFDILDTNRDGKISKSEYVVRMTNNFDRLDANKDGVIDQAELEKDKAAARSAAPTR